MRVWYSQCTTLNIVSSSAIIKSILTCSMLRATPHTRQEPWMWKWGSPKEVSNKFVVISYNSDNYHDGVVRFNTRPLPLHVLLFFFGTNWKFNCKEEPTTTSGESVQRRGNQEIMPILSLTFHVTTKLLQITIRPLTPLDWIKFVKNILVSNV